ncbi:hypothetical protein [Magnetospirillum molischianum]|uniref:Lipoprotein n=1 Tax=Magnetospirillum molischianum DSM 120 TaxID=1150626 RepID=H8FYD4_MAGML|nr:hypothetical protein [Magnetospirillum molischianum]CCG43372.1 exported hypothetical protein [Magnetospirillum molischianum DSM 120]
MRFVRTSSIAIALVGCLLTSACNEQSANAQQPQRATQAQKAQEAANAIAFTENAEIDNIKHRLELTSQPGLLGYVVLLNESGQPVWYGAVKGKITSGSKRLTDPRRVIWKSGQTNYTAAVTDAPSDEGTYGSSGEYVFFWTPSGQYVQWNGKYLYSDQPFRLSIKPLVVDVQGAEGVK